MACLGVLLFRLFAGQNARANPEVPLLYDARSTGMGGTGAAFLSSAAAAEHNPALLSQLSDVAMTATFSPYALKLEAPFLFTVGPRQVQSSVIFGPFAQLALAARLHDRVVVGIGAYLTSAAGGEYEKIPLQALSDAVPVPAAVRGSAKVATFAGELQLPVSVRISPSLSLGAAYRVTYAQAFADVRSTSNLPLSHASLSGTNFTGFQLGFLAQVHRKVQVGLSYRNNVSLDMHGSATEYKTQTADLTYTLPAKKYLSPHQGRLASSWLLFEDHLRLAADVRYWLYHAVDPALNNAFGAQVGGEWWFAHHIAARLGYSFGMSATTAQGAVPVGTPPGFGQGVTMGTGTSWHRFDIDLALGYVTTRTTVAASQVKLPQSAPGVYYARGFLGSLSVNYRI